MSVIFGIFCLIQATVTIAFVCPVSLRYVNSFYGKEINTPHFPKHKYDKVIYPLLILMIIANPVIMAGFGVWLIL